MSCMIMTDNAFYQIAKFYKNVGRILDMGYKPSFYSSDKSIIEMAQDLKRMNYEAFKIRYDEDYTEENILVDVKRCEDYNEIDYPRLIKTMLGFCYQCEEGFDIPKDVYIINDLANYLTGKLSMDEKARMNDYSLCEWY